MGQKGDNKMLVECEGSPITPQHRKQLYVHIAGLECNVQSLTYRLTTVLRNLEWVRHEVKYGLVHKGGNLVFSRNRGAEA